MLKYIGLKLLELHPREQDTIDLGELTYALYSSDDDVSTRFTLSNTLSEATGQNVGVMTVAGALNYEETASYEVVVNASDTAGNVASVAGKA